MIKQAIMPCLHEWEHKLLFSFLLKISSHKYVATECKITCIRVADDKMACQRLVLGMCNFKSQGLNRIPISCGKRSFRRENFGSFH